MLQAMSSTIGKSRSVGKATENGLLPSTASAPPQGVMWLMAPIVKLMPIMSRRAAISV